MQPYKYHFISVTVDYLNGKYSAKIFDENMKQLYTGSKSVAKKLDW